MEQAIGLRLMMDIVAIPQLIGRPYKPILYFNKGAKYFIWDNDIGLLRTQDAAQPAEVASI